MPGLPLKYILNHLEQVCAEGLSLVCVMAANRDYAHRRSGSDRLSPVKQPFFQLRVE